MPIHSQKNKTYDLISVSHYFPPRIGGLENMAYNLLEGLAKRDISVIALFGSDAEYIKTSKNFDQRSFKVKSVFGNSYPLFGMKFFTELIDLLKQNPNAKVLIHSRHLLSSTLASMACQRLKHPYTLVEHNAGPVYFKSKLLTRISNWADRHFFNSVIENAEDILAVSETGKKWVSGNFDIPMERISVIYNSFEVGEKCIDFDQKENTVVFASRWIPVKDPKTTLRAYMRLAEKYPDWTFVMAGEGGALTYDKDDLPNNIQVQGLLEQNELFALLRKSKIYVNSSMSEGLSLAILEAAALGNIPIVSKAESNREVAGLLGVENFTFTRRNSADLARKIEKSIKTSNDEAFVKTLIKQTHKIFSIDTMVDTYSARLLPRHIEQFKTLSIVIPVYNEERTVGDLLASVATFSLPKNMNKEIIIVNDGSTDESGDIIEKFIKTHRKSTDTYKYIRNNRNLGKSQTVKRGVLASTGELVVTQDADLEYTPGELNTFVKKFQEDKYLDAIYGNRFHSKNSFSNATHSWGNRFVTSISNTFTRMRGFAPKDMEICYKMVRGEIMRTLFQTVESETNFGLEPEITAKLARYRFPNGKKLKFSQVDISYVPRTKSAGKKMRWFKNGFEALLEILYYNIASFIVEERVSGRTVERRL